MKAVHNDVNVRCIDKTYLKLPCLVGPIQYMWKSRLHYETALKWNWVVFRNIKLKWFSDYSIVQWTMKSKGKKKKKKAVWHVGPWKENVFNWQWQQLKLKLLFFNLIASSFSTHRSPPPPAVFFLLSSNLTSCCSGEKPRLTAWGSLMSWHL